MFLSSTMVFQLLIGFKFVFLLDLFPIFRRANFAEPISLHLGSSRNGNKLNTYPYFWLYPSYIPILICFATEIVLFLMDMEFSTLLPSVFPNKTDTPPEKSSKSSSKPTSACCFFAKRPWKTQKHLQTIRQCPYFSGSNQAARSANTES